MKSSDIVGKTVHKVHQSRQATNAGHAWVLDGIEFTDGSCVRFTVYETDRGEYEIGAVYRPKEQ